MRNVMLGGRRAWLVLTVLPLLCGSAHALLPPLTDYRYNDGEREIELKMPDGWKVQKLDRGVRAQFDPRADVCGTVVLGFYQYDKAPTPDVFLQGALTNWSEHFDGWQVTASTAPPERPRVRLATVSFRQFGLPCTGYVMAVIGKETGTIGFAYADAVAANKMRLGDLVQMVVAGSYSAYPVRGGDGASPEATEAIQQAYDRLYGEGGPDFKSLWADMQKKKEIDNKLLDFCATYQPELRQLKTVYDNALVSRYQARSRELKVYCLPTHDFNAFAVGKNDMGPGFLAFHALLTRCFANLAQQYTYLRDRKLTQAQLAEAIASYETNLAAAVVRSQPLPAPDKIDFADQATLRRYTMVFHSMIGLVMTHEMAHYYLRHNISGQRHGDSLSVQQRELQADSAGMQNLQAAADKDDSVWEGGALYAFAMLATVDNVAQKISGKERGPEYMYDHPYGDTRYKIAVATLGRDNFQFRHDPWTNSTKLLQGDDGVDVIGGTGKDTPLATLVHPKSKVTFGVPEGWTARLDDKTGLITFQREGGGNLPLIMYQCGGDYANSKAITEAIMANMKKKAADYKEDRDLDINTGNDQIKLHLTQGVGTFGESKLALIALGIQSPGWNHGLMLITSPDNLGRDSKSLQELVVHMKFPMK